MEFFDLIKQTLGVDIHAFVLVSVAVLVVAAAVRRGVKGQPFAAKPWWKMVLTLGSIGLGIGVAFLADAASLYDALPPRLIIIGVFNGAVASTGWQLLKQVPAIKKLVVAVEGETKTVPPPEPPPEQLQP